MKTNIDKTNRLEVIRDHVDGTPFIVQDKDGGIWRVAITYDEFPLDPRRDMDNLGKLLCAHKRYRDLGDEWLEREDYEELKAKYENDDPNYAILPVYFFDHSVQHISTRDFGDPWDSGMIGYVFCTAEQYEKFMCEKFDKKKAYERMSEEVAEYDHYVSGEYMAIHTAKWQPCQAGQLPNPNDADQWDHTVGEVYGSLYGVTNIDAAIMDAVGVNYQPIDASNLAEAAGVAVNALADSVVKLPCPCGCGDTVSLYPVNGMKEGFCDKCGAFVRIAVK